MQDVRWYSEKRKRGYRPDVDYPSLAGKRYSVGKVRVPAGSSNMIPANAMLSIEQQFCACQGENDTNFRASQTKT